MIPSLAMNVTTYLNDLPDDRRNALLIVRELILAIWPQAREELVNNMPTYHLDGLQLCALANQKHFMVLYIAPYDLLTPFKNELKKYNCGRTCIRFREITGELLDLFDRVVKYTGSQLPTSQLARRPAAPVRGR
jgi:uncharacterized protein YdhG (YjbR/CyaY superfamily)